MASIGTYQYRDLVSQRSIRLLRIHREPSVRHDSIIASLEEVNLDQCPDYHAISYVWGDPTPQAKIQCDGLQLLVPQSCYEALRGLKCGQMGRIVWIDAICINQNSLSERAQQVQLMGTVYRNARRVLVWLGPSTEGTDLAMGRLKALALARLFGRQRQAVNELIEFDAHNREKYPFGILGEIFHRPWFQRLWVVQEVAMAKAKSTLAYCGDKMVPFVLLDVAVGFRDTFLLTPGLKYWQVHTGPVRDFQTAVQMKDKGRNLHPDLKLTQALVVSMLKKATMPEDKIFGFYGVAKHLGWSLPTPNYYTPIAQIYIAATKAAIEIDQSLELFRVAVGPKTQQLPSWVPDYSNPPRSFCKFMQEFRAAGRSRVVVQWPTNSAEVTISGVLLDVVDVCGCVLNWPIEQTIYNNQCPMPEMFWDAVQVAQTWLCLASDLPNHYEATNESVLSAFARTLFSDGLDKRDTTGALKMFTEFVYPFLTSHNLSDENVATTDIQRRDQACSLSIHTHANRSFVLTGGGLMATVPALTQQHDLIVIFAGSSYPSVIRQHEDKFELIGPAYVHGAMDGQFWPVDDSWLTEFTLI